MTPEVKAALIVAGAIIIATALWIYFSPLQTCVRLARANNYPEPVVSFCANAWGGTR